jgi:hypothetical protein
MQTHTNTRHLLRKPGLLEIVPISLRTLDTLMARKIVPYYKSGDVVLFDPDEVLAAIKAYKRQPKVRPKKDATKDSAVKKEKEATIV